MGYDFTCRNMAEFLGIFQTAGDIMRYLLIIWNPGFYQESIAMEFFNAYEILISQS